MSSKGKIHVGEIRRFTNLNNQSVIGRVVEVTDTHFHMCIIRNDLREEKQRMENGEGLAVAPGL